MRIIAAAVVLALACPLAGAAESDPLPVPQASPRAEALRAYNDGVRLLLARDFVSAQRLFEQALRQDDTLAEAHNNLAYSLRMQGAHNFERALAHYDRAVELKPTLAQAYMYRGVLFTQMGDLARARADHARLLVLDRALAARLQQAIDGAATDERAGIVGQHEY
jgi:Tfp pilus assembly protein PilF